MRTIKFRAWDKLNNKIINVESLAWRGNKLIFVNKGDMYRRDFHKIENIILMQYTGLKDKNGKEIYEGDILKGWMNGESEIRKVEWIEEQNGWSERESNEYTDLEIIGNVYEPLIR